MNQHLGVTLNLNWHSKPTFCGNYLLCLTIHSPSLFSVKIASFPPKLQLPNPQISGMDTIESLNSSAFQTYLSKTSNTICGRRPILLLLATIEEHSSRNPSSDAKFSFLHYSQSSRCVRKGDSSVSYASGVLTISWGWWYPL